MFRKKIICDKCGEVHKGYYIAPICKCGNQIKDFSDVESMAIETFDGLRADGKFQELHPLSKRNFLFELNWPAASRHRYWLSLITLLILYGTAILMFFAKGTIKYPVLIEIATWLIWLESILLFLAFMRIAGKTIYFRSLKKKDALLAREKGILFEKFSFY